MYPRNMENMCHISKHFRPRKRHFCLTILVCLIFKVGTTSIEISISQPQIAVGDTSLLQTYSTAITKLKLKIGLPVFMHFESINSTTIIHEFAQHWFKMINYLFCLNS